MTRLLLLTDHPEYTIQAGRFVITGVFSQVEFDAIISALNVEEVLIRETALFGWRNESRIDSIAVDRFLESTLSKFEPDGLDVIGFDFESLYSKVVPRLKARLGRFSTPVCLLGLRDGVVYWEDV